MFHSGTQFRRAITKLARPTAFWRAAPADHGGGIRLVVPKQRRGAEAIPLPAWSPDCSASVAGFTVSLWRVGEAWVWAAESSFDSAHGREDDPDVAWCLAMRKALSFAARPPV